MSEAKDLAQGHRSQILRSRTRLRRVPGSLRMTKALIERQPDECAAVPVGYEQSSEQRAIKLGPAVRA